MLVKIFRKKITIIYIFIRHWCNMATKKKLYIFNSASFNSKTRYLYLSICCSNRLRPCSTNYCYLIRFFLFIFYHFLRTNETHSEPQTCVNLDRRGGTTSIFFCVPTPACTIVLWKFFFVYHLWFFNVFVIFIRYLSGISGQTFLGFFCITSGIFSSSSVMYFPDTFKICQASLFSFVYRIC